MERTSSSHYNINYHFVWCPKYRKSVLTKEVKTYLKSLIEAICGARNWKVLEIEVMPDHIHLFISAPPYESPTGIIKVLKGVSAVNMLKRFEHLVKIYPQRHLWSPSYYVGTAGHVSAETIKRYIQEQETKKGGNSSIHSNG